MFTVNKKVIGELDKCYALSTLTYQGKDCFLVTAEKKAICLLFDLDGNLLQVSHHGDGGVMTMAPVPGKQGQFFATQKFYSPDDSAEAFLAIVTIKSDGDWDIRKIADCPFLHRFGILNRNGVNYLILCALKSGQKLPKDDWDFPGRVFGAILPENLDEYGPDHLIEKTVLLDNMTKNHGYYAFTDNRGIFSKEKGTQCAVVSCDSGSFLFAPPYKPGGNWTKRSIAKDGKLYECVTSEDDWLITQLSTYPTSDGLLLDLNEDGKEELCTIAPFHGDTIRIFGQDASGSFIPSYIYPKKLDFLHAIFGGQTAGKMIWVLGHRSNEKYLLAFTYENGAYHSQVLDEGKGAANVLHYVHDSKDYIIATNRESDEVAMYILT